MALVYTVVTEYLYDRNWASDTISTIRLVTMDSQKAKDVAAEIVQEAGLSLAPDEEAVWWDEDEGATFVKIVTNILEEKL